MTLDIMLYYTFVNLILWSRLMFENGGSGNEAVREVVLVSMFAALTAVGAFIKIPIPYVPFTLQFLFILFGDMLLGKKLGFLSQDVYLLVA